MTQSFLHGTGIAFPRNQKQLASGGPILQEVDVS